MFIIGLSVRDKKLSFVLNSEIIELSSFYFSFEIEMVKNENIKIVVGLTNSADSKVAAYLLNRQGYEVIGVTFFYMPSKKKLAADNNKSEGYEQLDFKCRVEDSKDIKSFCQKIGIQHLGYSADEEFKDEVIDICVAHRIKSASGNPCFGCSKLTLKLLYLKAKELGVDFISTGHYAKVHLSQTTKSYFLNAANDINSDQSFLLANISQEILSSLILPLGDLRKIEVNKIAQRQGWGANKKPLEKKCLSGSTFIEYVEKNVAKSLLSSGNVMKLNDDLSIGSHEGLHLQYFGEKFDGSIYPTTSPGEYVVVDVNRKKGAVYVEDKVLISCKRIFLNNLRIKKSAVKTKPKKVIVKIEENPITYPAIIHFKNNNSCLIILEKKVNKIFPSGTYVTIYEELFGGRLSILGSGRVRYESKFLEIQNGDKNDKKISDFEL